MTASAYKNWKKHYPNIPKPSRAILKELSRIATTMNIFKNHELTGLCIGLKKGNELILQKAATENSYVYPNYPPTLTQSEKHILENYSLDVLGIHAPFPPFDDDMVEFLYYFTGGNTETLKHFTQLILDFYVLSNPKPNLYLLKTDPYCSDFQELFKGILFTFKVNFRELDSLISLISLDSLKTLPICKPNIIRGYFISNPGILALEDKHKTFKKLVTGKTIFISDSLVKNIKFRNTLPCICHINSHQELTYFQNNHKYKILDFSNTDINTTKNSLRKIITSEIKISSLLYYMSALGSYFTFSEKQKVSKKKEIIIPHDNILNDFFRSASQTAI